MTAVNFAYWLQGYFEIGRSTGGLTAPQVDVIERHLSLVFAHEIDPSQGDAAHQAKLNEIHGGSPIRPNDKDDTGPFDGPALVRC